jgi:hypothetical protein
LPLLENEEIAILEAWSGWVTVLLGEQSILDRTF